MRAGRGRAAGDAAALNPVDLDGAKAAGLGRRITLQIEIYLALGRSLGFLYLKSEARQCCNFVQTASAVTKTCLPIRLRL